MTMDLDGNKLYRVKSIQKLMISQSFRNNDVKALKFTTEKIQSRGTALVNKLDLTKIPTLLCLITLLIDSWTSELAQHNHALFIKHKNELEFLDENDPFEVKKQELAEKIKFYRKNALIEKSNKGFLFK